MATEIFSNKDREKYVKELEAIKKIIQDSPTVESIQDSIIKKTPLPFAEVPKLHTDKEAILYANLVQPKCPDASTNLKLKNYLELFIETSGIHAQNAMRRENVEFKGFWSAVVCFLITLINHQTTMIIPLLIYEFGYGFIKWLLISYIFICYPALVFVTSLSQYSGLDSSRVYSRIKKVWRGMEYVVLLRTFCSILLILQELQYTSGPLSMLDVTSQSGRSYLDSCLETQDGCVNIGFIHPCSTGYGEDVKDNEQCRKINQVNFYKYIDPHPIIKTISTSQHMFVMLNTPIHEKSYLFSLIIPGLIVCLTTFFLYFGKAKCIVIVALLTLPILSGQLYGLVLLSGNNWSIEFQQLLNMEFVPSFNTAILVINITIRSLNMIDLVPKISASLSSKVKAIHISFFVILSIIIVISISTTLYITSTIFFKQLIMKNTSGYGRIPRYSLSNILPYIALPELFINNNKRYVNNAYIVCTIIQRCFILSMLIEIFYDYIRTTSMKFYNFFYNYNLFTKLVVVFFCYSSATFVLESTSYSLMGTQFMLQFLKIDGGILFIQFFIIAYVYGVDRYLGHLREMNGRVQLRDKVLKSFKYISPMFFGISMMATADPDKHDYYKDKIFHKDGVIAAVETSSVHILIIVTCPVLIFIVLEIVKTCIKGYYWKTAFRSMDVWGKRENKFIKASSLHDD
uniref:Sodium-dependent neutral amino acid transporter SLC6A17 n=1 Tax=Strongyloides venezuelensis TaxID=75913 RepID=A0A0K0EZ27_STRVS